MPKPKSKSHKTIAATPKPKAGELPSLPQMNDDDILVDTLVAAAELDVSHQWLELGRCKGYGPPYVKLTKRLVKYRRGDLRAYARKRITVLEKA